MIAWFYQCFRRYWARAIAGVLVVTAHAGSAAWAASHPAWFLAVPLADACEVHSLDSANSVEGSEDDPSQCPGSPLGGAPMAEEEVHDVVGDGLFESLSQFFHPVVYGWSNSPELESISLSRLGKPPRA